VNVCEFGRVDTSALAGSKQQRLHYGVQKIAIAGDDIDSVERSNDFAGGLKKVVAFVRLGPFAGSIG